MLSISKSSSILEKLAKKREEDKKNSSNSSCIYIVFYPCLVSKRWRWAKIQSPSALVSHLAPPNLTRPSPSIPPRGTSRSGPRRTRPPRMTRACWSRRRRRSPPTRGGDHDDACSDGDRDQALVLPSAAARPPTAGARPAPRGGLHHAPAADPRPAPRAAPAPGAVGRAGQKSRGSETDSKAKLRLSDTSKRSEGRSCGCQN